MKKKIVVILIAVLLFVLLNNKTSNVIIPESAIRFRVIANSDTMDDQYIKKEIRDTLQQELYPKLIHTSSIEEARQVINNDFENMSEVIENKLDELNMDTAFDMNYGINHFPKKEYKGVTYEEGNYESLVVTLGEGNGQNWWCVLFPPLCLLEAEETRSEEVEYKSFVKELIDKYFK